MSAVVVGLLVYFVITSWVFWALVGALVFLVGFAVSPALRVLVCLGAALCMVYLTHLL